MPEIRINDIFEELIEENQKITECLNVLIRFKTFVDLIFDKLKTNLESNVLQLFKDFHKETEEVFKRNEMDFTVNKTLIQRKTQLLELLSSKPQTSVENSLQLSSEESFDSTKVKPKGPKSRSSINKKKISSSDRRLNQMMTITEEGMNESFVCNFIGCGKRLKHKKSLRSHLKTHSTDPKAHQCHFDGCTFSTDKRVELRDHLNSHNGNKPFSCDFCEKCFTSDKLKKHHINYMHKIADQILVCEMDECYKQFKTELALKTHQKYNHLKEKKFVCEEINCSFKTISESILKTHLYYVHSGQRPFACHFEGCTKRYKNSNELNLHIESHSSERKFKCLIEGCDKAFKSEKFLRKHIRHIHSSEMMRCDWPGCEYTCKDAARLRGHQIIHISERKFLCDWPQCGKRFKNKVQLDTHLRIHKNDKRYACSWPGCQYRCTNSGNIIKHKRVHLRN